MVDSSLHLHVGILCYENNHKPDDLMAVLAAKTAPVKFPSSRAVVD